MSIAHLGIGPDDREFRDPPISEYEYGPERVPPHDLLAEQSMLGGMLLGGVSVIDDVLETTTAADLFIPKHAVAFDAILQVHGAGDPVDVITVTAELTRTGNLQRAGGAEYLHTLTGIVPTAANAGFYASIVAEKAMFRRLVEAGMRLTQMGYASEGDAHMIVGDALAELESVQAPVRSSELKMIGEDLWDFADVLEKKPEHNSTGWRALDHKIGGFARGEMVVVAARPGVGKSIVLLNAAMHAAHYGVVLFVSLEMKKHQLQARLVADFGDIHMKSLRDHTLTEQDWHSYKRAADRLNGAPVFLEVTSSITLAGIRALARQAKKRGDLVMIVVDYLQLVDADGHSREREVAKVSRGLKTMAMDLDVTTLAAVQLNRGQTDRNGVVSRPTLASMRESGQIEQDADTAILLHRDPKKPAESELIVAKSRNGEVGTVTMRWQPHFARLLDPVGQGEPLFDMGGMQ